MQEFEQDLKKMIERIASVVVIRIREGDIYNAHTDMIRELNAVVDLTRICVTSKK